MPVVLFGGIFATVPLLGVVMRYTIPPLSFVNYVGIVSRHRLFRSTNSHVPRCPVRAISVSAFLLLSIVPHGMRGCRSSAALCVSIASMSIVRHNMPVVLFGGIFATVPLLGIVMRYTIPPLSFVNYVGIVSRHRLFRATNSHVPRCPVCALSVSAFLLSSIVPHGMRGCRSSAALCVSIASMSIAPHGMRGVHH